MIVATVVCCTGGRPLWPRRHSSIAPASTELVTKSTRADGHPSRYHRRIAQEEGVELMASEHVASAHAAIKAPPYLTEMYDPDSLRL